MRATARAYSNIAFIKYWGNQDNKLRIPQNPSLSMNLDNLFTKTTVTWEKNTKKHQLELNGEVQSGATLERVSTYLEQLREYYNLQGYAHIKSENNFPTGAGIASSASAFAALALAATRAADITLAEKELSTAARLGSGSASRSIPGGFVEWHTGHNHETSFAESFAPADHWDLVDVIAVISQEHKKTGSTRGHTVAPTSDLQNARVAKSTDRLKQCKDAILHKDFEQFAEIVELDSNTMHAVMMTSRPPLFYWQPGSVEIMKLVPQWRKQGIQVCYTLDAGPNVHCLCQSSDMDAVKTRLSSLDCVQDIRTATCGGPAHLVT